MNKIVKEGSLRGRLDDLLGLLTNEEYKKIQKYLEEYEKEVAIGRKDEAIISIVLLLVMMFEVRSRETTNFIETGKRFILRVLEGRKEERKKGG